MGRGLSSLISTPSTVPNEDTSRRILDVPIEQVEPQRHQPRQRFDDDKLDGLAVSIKDKGVLLPLLVRREGRGYRLIAGERRWRAAQRAGLKEVPVLVDDADDDEAFELALIENIQREDLNPIEEAQAYDRLMEIHGCTQAQLATRVGKERSTVANALRLLKLPPGAREAVLDGRLSMGHARALLALEGESLERAARQVLAESLNVRQAEALVRELKRGGTKKKAAASQAASPQIRDLVARLQQALGTRVRLQDRGNKGTLSIEYSNLDELQRVVDRILGDR